MELNVNTFSAKWKIFSIKCLVTAHDNHCYSHLQNSDWRCNLDDSILCHTSIHMHIQKYVYRKMHLHEKKLISSHSPPEGRQSICKSAVLCVPCASTSKMFSGQKDIANVYFDVSKKVIINDLLIVNLELYSSLMLHNVLAVLLLFFF